MHLLHCLPHTVWEPTCHSSPVHILRDIGVGRCFIVRGPNLFSVESGT